ncbi:phenylacetate--CoA ligase [Taibaiella sp. KBW10]|uniref:phenylacetate--CoA ligase family protein n=1 Tax=Taibaiella sp. KBW10 TaxID=2153357 RepID=UPI000F5A8CEF|nr:AMP-binding protein [Taibaiella sp. KBW10]RQO31374.1 phenylacetate--CoA ligase [Taibaiella sp. KBW10]
MNKWTRHSKIEYAGLAAQQDFQLQQLKVLLQYVSVHSPFYKKQFNQYGIRIEDIQSLTYLERIPTTSKEDIQQYNWDFLCVDRASIAEYTATSGTLGTPVTIALTANDLERLAYNEYCSFKLMEVGEQDIIQLMLTLDKQFMAGMAYYKGAQELKASVIRTGPGLPQMQLEVMQRLQSGTLVAVPSFLLKMIHYAQEHHIDVNALSARKVLAIGESIRTEDLEDNILLQRIKKDWNIAIFGTYAATEMQTAFTECTQHRGGHLNTELLYVELLDEAGKQVPAGTVGEVTISTFGVEGMPLLRYRTGDLCKGYYEPCACGRTSMRLGPVTGRKQQMIKYKGTSVYPPTLFELLNGLDFIGEYVIELSLDDTGQDDLMLHLYLPVAEAMAMSNLKQRLQASLRVIPKINICDQESIARMQFPNGSRKQLKFIDRRY